MQQAELSFEELPTDLAEDLLMKSYTLKAAFGSHKIVLVLGINVPLQISLALEMLLVVVTGR